MSFKLRHYMHYFCRVIGLRSVRAPIQINNPPGKKGPPQRLFRYVQVSNNYWKFVNNFLYYEYECFFSSLLNHISRQICLNFTTVQLFTYSFSFCSQIPISHASRGGIFRGRLAVTGWRQNLWTFRFSNLDAK